MSPAMSTEKIKNRLKILDDIKRETKKLRAIYKETLEEKDSYQEIQEEKKKIRQQQQEQKLKLKNDPQISDYELQLKELREDMKENKEILAQELVEYYRETGKMEIVDDEGNTKRIVFSAKLIKG